MNLRDLTGPRQGNRIAVLQVVKSLCLAQAVVGYEPTEEAHVALDGSAVKVTYDAVCMIHRW